MTALDDLFRNIVIRRPALQRWSVTAGILPVIHSFVDMHYTSYKTWCKQNLPKIRDQLKEVNRFFRTDLEEELNTVLAAIDTLFHVVGDYLYDILVSGTPSLNGLLQDERLVSMLNRQLLGKSIDYLLRKPLGQLVDHIVDQTLLNTHTKLTNGFIHTRIKLVVRSFASSSSADDLLKIIRDADMAVSLLPIHNVLSKFAGDMWQDRDVYYEALRSALVIPHELVLCVHNEMAAQAPFDRAQQDVHRQTMNGIICGQHGEPPPPRAPSSSTPHAKKDHKDNTHVQAGQATSTATTTNTSTAATGSTPDPSLSAAYADTHQALLDAEQATFSLIEWYKTSGTLAQFQKRIQQTNKAMSFTRRFRKNSTDEQKQAKQSVADIQAQLHQQFHVSSDPKTHPPMTLLDFSLLQIVCAAAAPLHVYHNEWSSKERFVALTHHLHMLDALIPVPRLLKSAPSSKYCQHIKDIPAFGMQGMARGRSHWCTEKQENLCSALYNLDPEILPRDEIVSQSICGDYSTIKRVARAEHGRAKATYQRMKSKYGARQTNHQNTADVQPQPHDTNNTNNTHGANQGPDQDPVVNDPASPKQHVMSPRSSRRSSGTHKKRQSRRKKLLQHNQQRKSNRRHSEPTDPHSHTTKQHRLLAQPLPGTRDTDTDVAVGNTRPTKRASSTRGRRASAKRPSAKRPSTRTEIIR